MAGWYWLVLAGISWYRGFFGAKENNLPPGQFASPAA